MLKSAKSTSQDEELDDDGDFVVKKETSTANKGLLIRENRRKLILRYSHITVLNLYLCNLTFRTISAGELRIKVDGQSSDPKANTPRSKHSATEQRRRSKINDRQVLLLFNFELVIVTIGQCNIAEKRNFFIDYLFPYILDFMKVVCRICC